MRRFDPPPPSHLDADCGLPPAYADSDVGSSPRSVGASGGRSGSLTEDPPAAVKWDDAAFIRVKLMCSYGGRILPRPHDNQLRYVGGESRIVVVNRNVTFAELTSKLSKMFGASVAVKYQLPCEDLDALISVTSEEDLENMMEEYDRLQTAGNRTSSTFRLRLFLFPLKIERSQTSSLSDIMESNHNRDRWFVDALNGMPVLPRVRSETSSIISETPDYLLQGNMDSLEEWAAATSYGNSVPPPPPEQSPDKDQSTSVSAATVFGSLLQHSGSGEVSSAPGSPSPSLFKAKSFLMGSSSSAPPAVISMLSAMAEAASKGQPTSTQQAGLDMDGNMAAVPLNSWLGSGGVMEQRGGGGSIPEQKQHVDSEILPTSDKGISNSSVGTAEQLLPAGLMDDDDVMQKLPAKGSDDQMGETRQKVMFDAGVHQVVTEAFKVSGALKVGSELEIPALMGKPIFDEEVPPVHMLAQNLKVLQTEEKVSSPISSPTVVSSASAQVLPTVLVSQQPVPVVVASKLGADDRLKQQVSPSSAHAVASKLGGEDRLMQQVSPASTHVAALKAGGEDRLMQQAQFLPPLGISQQVPIVAASKLGGEDTLMQRIPRVNTTKDVVGPETALQLQQPSSSTSGSPVAVSSQPSVPPALYQPVMQKPAVLPVSTNFYQLQQQQQLLEETMSATTYATQGPGIQLPIMSQTPSPAIGVATAPSPTAPFKPAIVPLGTNMAAATRLPAALSYPPSTPIIAPGAGGFQQPLPQQLPQVKTTSPPPSVPPIMVTNVSPSTVFSSMGEGVKGIPPMVTNVSPSTVFSSMGEDVKGIPPMLTNVSPSTVFSSMGEGVKGVPPMVHQQVEVAHLQRQVGDTLYGQRVAAISPQHGSQFSAGNPSAPIATGLPSRFRAVGRPVQQVAEGIPHQQSPMIGVISDKKLPVPVQRVAPMPSARPPLAPATQYSYYMLEQPNALPQPTAIGVVPRYNAPSNVMITGAANSPDTLLFVGANPFVDEKRPVSPYPDVLEVPPADQQQRRQMRP